ncbi:hypothetical protein Bpfe_007334, partial [Biomphalaria pfeifferi]
MHTSQRGTADCSGEIGCVNKRLVPSTCRVERTTRSATWISFRAINCDSIAFADHWITFTIHWEYRSRLDPV